MAFLHNSIFVRSIGPIYATDDVKLGAIMSLYRERNLGLAQFGVAVHEADKFDLSLACEYAEQLTRRAMPASLDNGDKSTLDSLTELLAECNVAEAEHRACAVLDACTPLDSVALIRRTIDAIVQAANIAMAQENDFGHAVATDDLIPLLAYVIVKSGVQNLESWFFWVKTFAQSDLGAEFE